MRRPKNLVQHELIGLEVEVVDSSNSKNIGIKGKVVDETRNTLVVEKRNGKEVVLIKEENIFIFDLGEERVRVDGRVLVGRPEDRIKKKLKRW